MKTILLATDFSMASRNASLYGAQLAKAMNATIILFAAYEASQTGEARNSQMPNEDLVKQTKQKLSDEAVIIANKENLNIQVACAEGTAEKSMLVIAGETEADLIIVGIKQGDNSKKRRLGSTLTSLIKESTIPVVIVPHQATFSMPAKVLYASDVFLDILIQPMNQIQWITDFFKSKLYVLRLVKDNYEKLLEEVNVPQRLTPELKKINTSFQFTVNENLSNALDEFIGEQPVDMLIIKPRKHAWLESLFPENDVKDRISHTHIPILVLPQLPGDTWELSAPVTTEKESELQNSTRSVTAQVASFISKQFYDIKTKLRLSVKSN